MNQQTQQTESFLTVFSTREIFVHLITVVMSDNFSPQDRLAFCSLFATCVLFDQGILRTDWERVSGNALRLRRNFTGMCCRQVMAIYNSYSSMNPGNRLVSMNVFLPDPTHIRAWTNRIVPGGVSVDPQHRVVEEMFILRNVLFMCLAVDGSLDALIAYGVCATRANRQDAMQLMENLLRKYRADPNRYWPLAVFNSLRARSLRRLLRSSFHVQDITGFLPVDQSRRFNLRVFTGMHYTISPMDIATQNRLTGNRGAYLYLRPG